MQDTKTNRNSMKRGKRTTLTVRPTKGSLSCIFLLEISEIDGPGTIRMVLNLMIESIKNYVVQGSGFPGPNFYISLTFYNNSEKIPFNNNDPLLVHYSS